MGENTIKGRVIATHGEILHELIKAEKKFPWWPTDILHAVSILQEESGELVKACVQYHYGGGLLDSVRHELYQTGAMVYRFALGIDTGYVIPVEVTSADVFHFRQNLNTIVEDCKVDDEDEVERREQRYVETWLKERGLKFVKL